ncbi:NLI interacting factor-like phosphatase [Ceratobasidium sp. AG-Ba]|nr:NLI interacting factor-like phosphatase [Ceratobasidium sp. AG-Ba]QRW09091.1 NLI interacting factor-like phosphatase [Ceratobasidium sp. AG-Ba]
MVEIGMIGDERRNYRISFCLDYSSMFKVAYTRDTERSIHYVKALRVIWERFPQFGPENTVHIDDQNRNFTLNPSEGIRVPPFKLSKIRRLHDDREL